MGLLLETVGWHVLNAGQEKQFHCGAVFSGGLLRKQTQL